MELIIGITYLNEIATISAPAVKKNVKSGNSLSIFQTSHPWTLLPVAFSTFGSRATGLWVRGSGFLIRVNNSSSYSPIFTAEIAEYAEIYFGSRVTVHASRISLRTPQLRTFSSPFTYSPSLSPVEGAPLAFKDLNLIF